MKRQKIMAIALGVALLGVAPIILSIGRITHCGKSVEASNLRSISVGRMTLYSTNIDYRRSNSYKDMKALLIGFATMDFTDSALFLDTRDLEYVDRSPPPRFAYLNEENEQVFISEILNLPIGFSFAVYEDFPSNASTRPLLWTRGLHRYKEFDQPYGGYVAYMDGHVTYYDGFPDTHDSALEHIFSSESGYTDTTKILEHVPDAWKDKGLKPLPVRYAEKSKQQDRLEKIRKTFEFLILLFGLGLVAALFCKGSGRRKLACGVVAFIVSLGLLVFINWVGVVR